MKTITTFIPTVHYRGFAFGYDAATGEQVYIPTGVVDTCGIKGGETLDFVVVPNHPDKAVDVPHKAVGVPNIGDYVPKPQEVEQEYEPLTHSEVVDTVKSSTRVWSAKDVGEYLGAAGDGEWKLVNNALRMAHERGDLARAGVAAAASQGKLSAVFYAASTEILKKALSYK